MNPEEEYLTRWLTKEREYYGKRLVPDGYYYAGIYDFVLQHGVWFPAVPFTSGIRKGRAKNCFLNAAVLADDYDYKYVEGFAVGGGKAMFPVHHAWNLDRDGKLFDRTWKNSGLAYLGVVFPFSRIASASGRIPLLDDPKSEFAIFREPWTGEK